MASGDRQKNAAARTPEMAELSRDVLSAVAHELGGIGSALDLRAAALVQVIPERDVAALRELANELRVATRTVRFVRGADDFGMLNPSRLQTIDEWWRFTRRLTGAVLPRGAQVAVTLLDATLTPVQSEALSWQLLVACKELAACGLHVPCVLTLEGRTVVNGHGAVGLFAHLPPGALVAAPDANSRWRRFGAALATDQGVEAPTWEYGPAGLRWSYVVAGEVTA